MSLLSACSKKQSTRSGCPIVPCPLDLGTFVTYVNNDGSAIEVKDFHAVDLRTNTTITTSGTVKLNPGTYVIADYSDSKLFSAAGDDVQVTATDSLTGQIKTVNFKLALPVCSCGIEKISGPDTVKFN